MKYNPKIHHRRSIRKKGYDYSSPGYYYITICCKNMSHLYGKIETEKMILNDAGKMIEKWYWKLEDKYPNIRCQEMIIMPNHFHCIIQITHAVRADPRVCPPPGTGENLDFNKPLSDDALSDDAINSLRELGEHVGSTLPHDADIDSLGENVEHKNSSLSLVLQWFKTMTTNEYIRGVKTLGWKRFDGKMWHRNYWEHIIRDERSYQRIAKYIIDNPKNWNKDKFRD